MSSNLEICPEIVPIEDNIEHEDSIVAPFDTDDFFRCDLPFLVIVLLILFFFSAYFWGVEFGIFHWKFEDIYY